MTNKSSVLMFVAALGVAVAQAQGSAQGPAQGPAQAPLMAAPPPPAGPKTKTVEVELPTDWWPKEEKKDDKKK